MIVDQFLSVGGAGQPNCIEEHKNIPLCKGKKCRFTGARPCCPAV